MTIEETQVTTDTEAPAADPAPEALESGTQVTAPDGEQPEQAAEQPAEPTPEEASRAAKMRSIEQAKREQLSMAAQRRQLEGRAREIQTWHQHIEERERELSAKEQRIKEFERAIADGDLEYLEKAGFSYEQATQRYLSRSTPEGKAQAAIERAEKLERELQERERRQAEAQAQQRELAEQRTVASKLVALVDDHADEFPELAEWPPERIAAEGLAFRRAFFERFRQNPTFDQALQHLHGAARYEAEHRSKRSAQRTGPSSSGAVGSGKVAPQQAQRATGQTETTPTLGNALSATRATPPQEMTEEEKDAFAIAELRKLSRGAAA